MSPSEGLALFKGLLACTAHCLEGLTGLYLEDKWLFSLLLRGDFMLHGFISCPPQLLSQTAIPHDSADLIHPYIAGRSKAPQRYSGPSPLALGK